MSYTLTSPDGSSATIVVPDKVEIEAAGLVFTGKNKFSYGEERNQNIVSLAANFSSEESGTSPGEPDSNIISNPLIGQIWHDQTADNFKYWNGSNWVSITGSVSSNNITVSPPINGESDLQSVLETLDSAIDNHIADTTGAHAATAISFDDTGLSNISASTVQNALEDLDAAIGSGGSVSASSVTVSPTVNGDSDAQAALETLDSAIDNHIADTIGAHAATAISFDDTGLSNISATTVQNALEDLDAAVGSGGSVTASAVTVSPTVNGDSDAQAALETLDSAIDNHIADTSGAHAATAISFDDTGLSNVSATTVQNALEDLDSAVAGAGAVSEVGTSASFSASARSFRSIVNPISGTPDIMQLIFVNQVSDLGYAPGDIVVINPQGNQLDEGSGPSQEGTLLGYDNSTNRITVVLNSNKVGQQLIVDRSIPTATSNLSQINASSWNAFVKVIKF